VRLLTRARLSKGLAFSGVLAAMAAVSGIAAPSASAVCDNGAWWNIASQNHSPGEGHSCNIFGPSTGETVLSTFDGGYSTIRAFCSTAGGSWTQSALIQYNVPFRFFECSPLVGVQNNHPNTIWVNSRHNDS
jgi:hypothetical protein